MTRELLGAVAPAGTEVAAFDDHVDAHFSYDLTHSHAITAELFALLVKFVDTTILTWVERSARINQLSGLIKTVQYLKPYLSRQLNRSPPFDKDYRKVIDWVNDLTRLVTIFGPYLIELPSSIRTLIPPLCPTSSVLNRTYAGRCRPKVICSLNQTWDERLSCLLLSSTALSLACNPQYLAIGLANGSITVFNSSTLEVLATLVHGRSSIQRLAFGNISSVLASCDYGRLTLWRLPNDRHWTAPLPQESRCVCFNADDSKLYVAVKGNIDAAILTFDARNGRQIKPLPITRDSSDSDEFPSDWRGTRKKYIPHLIRIRPVLNPVAVAYRSSHLTLFSLDGEDTLEKICRFKKNGYDSADLPTHILDVAFNTAVESNLIALSYQDGDIVTAEIDGWNTFQVKSTNLYASVPASSPDGRTLAAADNEGGICLFTFDTLRLIRRIKALEEVAIAIVFSSSSLRFYDIRGKNCNVWEPPELVRKSGVDDSSSDPDEMTAAPVQSIDKYYTPPFDDTQDITVMTPLDDGRFMFCGRENGSVTIHDTSSEKRMLELQLHSTDLRHLAWQPREKVLLSIDTSGRCIGTQLSVSPWRKLEQKLYHCASGAVNQAVLRPEGLAILLSTQTGEELWEDGKVSISRYSAQADRWMLHPTDEKRLLLFQGDKVHLYKWSGLE